MTGPEHYRVSERLIEDANRENGQREPDLLRINLALNAAHVHATLALAAATALAHFGEDEPEAWAEVCGVAEATDG